MPRAPVHRMKKQDIVKLSKWHCEHGETGLTHYNCWLKANPTEMKVGVIDIEASQLRADWGIVLCVSIADLDSDHIFVRTITKKEVFSESIDKKLLEDVMEEMRKYDKLIGFYASNMRFDIPFLRTRCVIHGIAFPEFGEIIMEDLYPVIKYKFKLSSNRLGNVCEALLGNTTKTHWLWKHWLRAVQGKQASLDYIEQHCIEDVKETKRLYQKVYQFNKVASASL